ncbi:hypothetical protein K3495_g13588 [Podosphaera aphanis]|nr:hypothetical protein K3495_g13588 [Podosphaera aphanis]
MAATKCRNCGGLHRSDSRKCLARPTRSGAPTKEQLKIYRQAGEREYQATIRAKAAEELAASATVNNIEIISSQASEVDNNIDNIPASSVEISTDDDVLNFMSINVGRGGTTHDIALARASELKTDVLLVQEPWWYNRTKSHPYFDLYLPFGGENIRPRAATYLRKDPNRIRSIQKHPLEPTSDYCWVEVNGIMFLNVYKAPHDPSAVQPLLNWIPTPKTVAIGDFNSVYWAWQPSASNHYGQGEEIEKWAEEHNLTCLIVGEPTHRAGNTLDLAFTNIRETMAWVGTEEVVTQWLPCLRLINTIEEIDNFAQDISWALENALKAVGKKPNRKSGRGAPWWTAECKSAQLDYREAVEVSERREMARSFRATVASSKREYWKSRIENMRSPRDVFKLMRWASPRNAAITPPLRYEGRFISDQEERAEILRDSLLA